MNPGATLVRARFGVPDFHREGGETFFLHPMTRLRYRVNETGRAILESVRTEISLSELHRVVAASFEVQNEDARSAVDAFVGKMSELGVLELSRNDDLIGMLRSRYLDLLRRALMNLIYPENELRIDLLSSGEPLAGKESEQRLRDIRYTDAQDFEDLIAAKQDGGIFRGRPWRFSHTMIGMRRLEHLQWCAERVFEDKVPGDFLEAGVCQGGASIFLRALQVAYGEGERRTWLADSFEGLPVPSHEADANYDFSAEKQPWLSFDRRTVEDNFRTYDLLSDKVQFIPGWFRDTLPTAPIPQLAILRADADLYESTSEILRFLYDKLAPGGFVIFDDYGAFMPCRKAVHEFRDERGITEPLRAIDSHARYWRKER